MRILLLNLYFPPDTSATARVAEAIVHKLAQTHEVTVLCGRPSYDPTERRPWKFWQTEHFTTKKFPDALPNSKNSGDLSTFTVIRVGSTDFSRKQMNLRILNYLTFTKLAFWRALFIPCDIVFAMTDPPFAGILAAWIALLKRKPLVYDIQDMYPDMAVAGSIVQPGLLSRLWEGLHRWALRRAARVIVLGEDMRTRIIAKGIDPTKIFIVRNAVDPLPTHPATPDIDFHVARSRGPHLNPEVVKAIRGNFRFVLLHAGNLGFYGAWDAIIAAARLLQDQSIGILFVGDGAERARLQTLATGATNIRFLPFFSSSEIPSVLAAPDVHIVSIKRGLEGVVVPSKMFGIMAAAKPILAIAPAETDVATLGARYGFAVNVDPDNASQIASAIQQLASDPAGVIRMGESAAYAASQYSRAGELGKLGEILQTLLF
jgi:colanic acid biosynthesis glycosyl transferase WcaI